MAEPEPLRLLVGDTAPDHARTVTDLAAALRVSEARVCALEAQQRHARTLDAVGQLVGGVAHDFNNLLTAILGYCDLILDQVPDEDPLRPDLLEIQSAGERAASLTRQLLAFSPRETRQPQIVNINTLVAPMEMLLRRLISEDVVLATTLAPDLRPVSVDPASVEQILANLAVNARDAMPGGGRLTIETANVEIDDPGAAPDATMVPGPYVMLAVGDTGAGEDAAARAAPWRASLSGEPQAAPWRASLSGEPQAAPWRASLSGEPQAFESGGFGLATVYGVVKQCGGYVSADRRPGQGSAFRIYLPATVSAPAASDDERAPGWETVLLVDDEDAVRVLAREGLRRRGYVVLDARDGVDALRVAGCYPGDIHLMITDIVMPNMNGRELAERLDAVRPTMKTLFVSGYADHALLRGELAGAFLSKPFTPDTLARKVRSILDADGRTAHRL